MNSTKRRVKILCTLGPAVNSKEKLKALALTGMDIVRLNFSHGKHDDFRKTIETVRSIEKEINRPLSILADLQGPKIRVARLRGGELLLKSGQEVLFTVEPIEGFIDGTTAVIPVGYKDFVKDVPATATILLDDGLMELKALEKVGDRLRCEVISGGLLKENKGINVPEAAFSALAITEKDYSDMLFCVEQGVDFIALSFVRQAQEVRHLKEFIRARNRNIQVVSKIEKRDALQNLDAIIDASDAVLVARGDLAVEVGNERVPVLQKQIVRKCNLRGKPVIIATQMLMSMVENPRPSRAEASDVANAIVDGTDVVMLSNETAVGKYPLESVEMMGKIALEMEQEPMGEPIYYNQWELPAEGQLAVALLQSAVRLATIVDAKAMVVISQSGRSANLVSKCRPQCPIFAITGSLETYHHLAMAWGVEPLFMEDMESLITQTAVFDAIGDRLRSWNLLKSGDKIIITVGLPTLAHGSTNTIKVHTIR